MVTMFETKCGEVLSALLAMVVALSMFTAPDTTMVIQTMQDALPQWAIFSFACSVFCLLTCFTAHSRFMKTARFLSGCVWGTFILIFALVGQWFLPIFGIATVMFAFDVYLVVVKGQSWAVRSNF